MIKTEKRESIGGVYWMAWVDSHPDNYSLGDTKEKAIAYLKRAIFSRPDIYGHELVLKYCGQESKL